MTPLSTQAAVAFPLTSTVTWGSVESTEEVERETGGDDQLISGSALNCDTHSAVKAKNSIFFMFTIFLT